MSDTNLLLKLQQSLDRLQKSDPCLCCDSILDSVVLLEISMEAVDLLCWVNNILSKQIADGVVDEEITEFLGESEKFLGVEK